MARAQMKKTRVIISGCCGRMGATLIALARETEGIELVGALERPGHPCKGEDAGTCNGVGHAGVAVEVELARVARRGDAIIEFSTPDATTIHAQEAARLRCPIVVGTTGLSVPQQAALRRAARHTPVLIAPNMSLGVNVLFQLAEAAVNALGANYEIEIIETHHTGKQDAPSGTAVRLAQGLAKQRKQTLPEVAVYGRHGRQPRRAPSEIGIHAVRAGDVVGDHQVLFAAPGERLELVHRASSRETFARGALRAARFVSRKSSGLYDMHDAMAGIT